ncbi:hypothetical protein B0H66DRAFT_480110 [Apodospora peruviana]|uniref:Uncharacterized protein n=1 Tax=Apodospora peruviana TaxID=516989 RepID=A0AAE0HZX6_9PEZI|nr:hypothetical protein B0H66DRAFT_480110 [Apodospora peruviana]
MGKFTFPLPGRRQKPPQPSPSITGPLTKAQKVLGTGGINTDSPTLSPDSKWGWDSISNSGISIAVSETTASHTDAGETGLGIVHEGEVAAPSPRREARWDEESEIIPRGLNRPSSKGMMGGGGQETDASSLRRRQSSSTITSYYDKTKLPLSISQQTSNSAMAKGLPAKVHALLDIDGTISESKEKKKKPTRLDLSSLIPKSISQRHLKPDVDRGHVLGPDMITKSPSVMSASPDMTPPPIKQRTERFLRKKKTKESLKEMPSLPESHAIQGPQYQPQGHVRRPQTANSPSAGGHRPTKSTVNLYNLYEHYEQRSFADALDLETPPDQGTAPDYQFPPNKVIAAYPTPPATSPDKDFLSPLPSNIPRTQPFTKQSLMASSAPELSLSVGLSPLSLISPPTDSASISSRHTRTSKASKRTDRSLTDLDLQQNSVLSLSSDSEDDGYEPSSKSSLAVPPPSDGQASPTSPRSAMSQRSGTSTSQDSGRGKPPKRTSFATNPQFLPIPERDGLPILPKINTRSSSLFPSLATPTKQALHHQTSRQSTGSTSTAKNSMYGNQQSPNIQDPKTINMVRRNSPPHQPNWVASNDHEFNNFPTPPTHRSSSQRPSPASRNSDHPTPPLSPTSVDFYLQSQRTSLATGVDNGSIRSGSSLDSKPAKGNGGRRSSAASSLHDNNSGRFMAVTRQEEMLLAALRMKRARMREDIIAEFEEADYMDRTDGEQPLHRHATNDSSASSSRISRQSSASTMRNNTMLSESGAAASLSMRPQHHQTPMRSATSSGSLSKSAAASSKGGKGQILLMLDRPINNAVCETAEPTPDLSDFMDFDEEGGENFPMQRHSIPAETNPDTGEERRSSNASSSKASSRSSKSAASSSRAPSSSKSRIERDIPAQILEEEPLEEDEDEETLGVPRPDSPVSPVVFPLPMAMTRKKQVRLSAVGSYKPNVEAGWWDDSG